MRAIFLKRKLALEFSFFGISIDKTLNMTLSPCNAEKRTETLDRQGGKEEEKEQE